MRHPPLAFVLAAVAILLLPSCARSRGGAADVPASTVTTVRRARVELALGARSVSTLAETLPFTLRVVNPAARPVRVDFSGEPPTPRGFKEKIAIPALWWTIERRDIVSGAESVHQRFTTRDTVLAAGGVLEVPLTHSLREIGLTPGEYRIRGGIGGHASGWERFQVTQ